MDERGAPEPQQDTSIRRFFDIDYMKTKHGIIKEALMPLGLLTFIIVAASSCTSNSSATGFFGFAFMTAFVWTLILWILYLTRITSKATFIAWDLTEFISSIIDVCTQAVASFVMFAFTCDGNAGVIVGAILGIVTSAGYGFNAFMHFRAFQQRVRANRPAQEIKHSVPV